MKSFEELQEDFERQVKSLESGISKIFTRNAHNVNCIRDILVMSGEDRNEVIATVSFTGFVDEKEYKKLQTLIRMFEKTYIDALKRNQDLFYEVNKSNYTYELDCGMCDDDMDRDDGRKYVYVGLLAKLTITCEIGEL